VVRRIEQQEHAEQHAAGAQGRARQRRLAEALIAQHGRHVGVPAEHELAGRQPDGGQVAQPREQGIRVGGWARLAQRREQVDRDRTRRRGRHRPPIATEPACR
jgi:hypothetical protein